MACRNAHKRVFVGCLQFAAAWLDLDLGRRMVRGCHITESNQP
jgi:hypothetical protein